MSAATEAHVRAVVGDDVAFLRKPFDMPSQLRSIHAALGAKTRR